MSDAAAGRDQFSAQLTGLCADFPTRTKWLVVPTHGTGRMLGDSLAINGRALANLRFMTPLDVALRMGAPFLVERGIDPSEEGLGAALIMRLLLGLPPKSSYFRPLANHPAMAQALWSTIRELRMAGIDSSELKESAFASGDKHAEFQALYRSYEEYLAKNNRGDMASVYQEALKHLDWCPMQAEDCWIELPDTVWAPLERQLLDKVSGERLIPQTQSVAGARRPRRLSDVPVVEVENDAPALGYLLSPDAAPTKDARVELFHAGGREAEVEEVFRRILALDCSLDQVEIACGSDEYAPLLWEKALRYDWRVTMASGLPASLTRPGRALVAFGEWIESDFASGTLRRLLQSGDVTLGEGDLAPGHAAAILLKANAAWGRDTYGLALGRLSRRYRQRADDGELPDEQRSSAKKRAEHADALLAWVTSLLNGVPLADADGTIDLQELVDGTVEFVETYTSAKSAIDRAAAAALTSAIAELNALGAYRCTLAAGLRFIRERVEGLRVGTDRSRPGHLFISKLAQVGYSGRPHVFVVGLEEGRLFPSATEDPVLLDSERSAISPLLQLSSDRIEEAVFNIVHRLAATSATSSICLSYSCRDLREFRASYPSWLMLQAYRIVSSNAAASFPDLMKTLGEPASCVPTTADSTLGPSDWWLHGLKRAGEPGRATVLGHFQPLADGVTADTHRQGDAFTEFDGCVPEAGAVLDPCVREGALSATQLEGAAQCPFRYFLERGLQVSAIDDGAREQDLWLDPMTRGSLMHELFATFMRRCRDENRQMSATADMEWCLTRGREALDKLKAEMPPPSQEVYEREVGGVLDDLSLFVHAEAARDKSRQPLGFEVSFGRPGEADEPLRQAEPIVIDLGGGLSFRLAGQIDRIDQVGNNECEIIDYKTGGYWADEWSGTFGGGRKLQHALYGLAAVELLKKEVKNPKVTKGVYYFPSAKGRQTVKEIPTQSQATVRKVLGDLRDVIASGSFIHADDESACKFCDYGPACGSSAHQNAAPKIANSELLASYRNLVSHE
jgi:ATP-dependent helicase/nuclease subunit B